MTIFRLALKTLIFFSLIAAAYYFLYALPQKRSQEVLTREYFNLLQNRIAYVELIKLDPQNPNFQSQKTDLIVKIKETNAEGLNSKYGTEEIMQVQREILEELFKTKTYEEGITVLKSEKSVKMLTSETNLLGSLGRRLR